MNATDNDKRNGTEQPHQSRGGVRVVSGVLLTALLLIAACGGSSDSAKTPLDPDDADESDVPPSSEADPDPVDATRPEGEWTLVATDRTRSDFAELVPGVSFVSLIDFDPSCESGPCDLTGNPAGVRGTFDAEGEPVNPADTTAPEPRKYVWNAADSIYTRTVEKVSGCTTKTLETVEDAYLYTVSTTLTFHVAEGDRPARLEGSYETRVEQNPDAAVDECTGYVQTGSVVGTPTGAVDIGDIDLTGEYTITEAQIERLPETESRSSAPVLIDTFTIDGSTITGWIAEPTELKQSGATMSGTSSTSAVCDTEPETPDGYTTTESFDDLRVAALTADGDPIIIGLWALEHTPTPAGAALGCEGASERGFLVFLPTAALS